MTDWDEEDLTKFFEFLDELRESGETNMYGAGSYLQNEYWISRKAASEILATWMKTFDRDAAPSERAAKFLADEPFSDE